MRKTVPQRIFRAILFGRFEPIETAIAAWSALSGLLILLPWNDGVLNTSKEYLVYDNLYIFKTVGVLALLLGVAHIFFTAKSDILRQNSWYSRRTNTLLAITMLLLFTTAEVFLEVGLYHPRWLTYLTMTVASAVSYLSLVIKR